MGTSTRWSYRSEVSAGDCEKSFPLIVRLRGEDDTDQVENQTQRTDVQIDAAMRPGTGGTEEDEDHREQPL